MAVTSVTKVYTTAISAVLDANIEGLYDNIFESSPTLKYMWGKVPLSGNAPGSTKVRKDISGGDKIMVNVEYGKSSGLKRMISKADTLDLTPSEFVTKAYYEKFWYVQPAIVFDMDLLKVKGKHALLDLAKATKNNALKTLAYYIATDMFGDGATAGYMTGFLQAIYKDGTVSTGSTFGGIAPGTETWWKNQFLESTHWWLASEQDPNEYLIIPKMEELMAKCVKGGMGRSPDLGICNDPGFRYLAQALVLRNGPTTTDLQDLKYGVRSITWGATKFLYEPYMPYDMYNTSTTSTTGDILLVNTETLFPVVDPAVNFTFSGPERSPQQLADVWNIQFYGHPCVCNNRRANGVLFNIETAAAS